MMNWSGAMQDVTNPPLEGTAAAGSRADDVCRWLRTAIVTGKIRPNEPLIETDLALRLQVSRTPIRESLQRLASEGLIVPRKRGWSVREYTPEEARQNCEIRAALEGFATSLAAERANDAEFRRIEAVHEHRLALQAVNEEVMVQTNRAFHDAIMAAAHNPRLTDAIFRCGQFYFHGRAARLGTEEEFRAANVDHGRIVAALLRRDTVEAERAMRDHVFRSFSAFQRVSLG
jgi:DNA-binding GntR family transcriptional regulator